jgi:spore coat protein U-like protein
MNRNRIVKHLSIWSLSAVAVCLAVPDAHAQTATSNFTVSAAVVRNCSISTVPMNFGNYDPVSANATTPLTVNGSVTIACTRGTTARIELNPGTNSANATAPETRAMAGTGPSGTEYLSYELYKDSTFGNVWGTGNPGNSLLVPAAASRNPQPFTIFGRIPAGQDRSVANYSDTVTATVNF